MNEILDKIKEFADKAHGTQMRKYEAARYIVHPVRVMETCRNYTSEITILAAALLHDVLEDTEVTKEHIADFLLALMDKPHVLKTIGFVEELTDVYTKINFPQFRRRKRKELEADRVAGTSPDAQTIKYADIIDNASEVVDNDPAFAKVFLPEYRALLKRIPHGNKDLYRKAIEIVNTGIARLS